jgi:hypothetical protein
MSRDDLAMFVSLAQFVLDVGEMQIAETKLFLQRFQNLEAVQRMRDELAKLPEGEAKSTLQNQADALSQKQAAQFADADQNILRCAARLESDHEKIEAALAKMKSSLQGH